MNDGVITNRPGADQHEGNQVQAPEENRNPTWPTCTWPRGRYLAEVGHEVVELRARHGVGSSH